MIHALDLPVLRRDPDYNLLRKTLESLIVPTPTFLAPPPAPLDGGIITWLTRLVSSPLAYLNMEDREDVYRLASELLSTECGRSARPSMTRTFHVPLHSTRHTGAHHQDNGKSCEDDERKTLAIDIHEPTLTADSLGLKTWSTSFLISRSLGTILPLIEGSVLELGSGTGLLGITIGKLHNVEITLTDYLPEIVQNLQGNVERNQVFSAQVELLDWTDAAASVIYGKEYNLVVVSDFMYDASHAALVYAMLVQFTKCGGQALAAYPLRLANADFIVDFLDRMQTSKAMWQEIKSGKEIGYDDWGGQEETIVHWHLYRRL